jgi:hypothetical protein
MMSPQNNVTHDIITDKIEIPIADTTMEAAGDYAQQVKELPRPIPGLRIATYAIRVPVQANGSSRTQVLLSDTTSAVVKTATRSSGPKDRHRALGLQHKKRKYDGQ